nr:gliding motility-associated C-terminal domain-containing protein [Saprospiraceae bacterium]
SFIEITPNADINAIAIGPDCPDIISSVSTYYYFDNLVLADLESFKFKISEILHPCNGSFNLEVPSRGDLSFQWYKEGIALLGETSHKLSKMYGEGNYQARVLDSNDNCKLTEVYSFKKPIFYTSATKNICKGSSYEFGNKVLNETGVYTHTFKNSDNCDSTVLLNFKVIGESYDTVNAKIFTGDSYQVGKYKLKSEEQHIVLLKSSIGCDSFVLVNLKHFKVDFPNIFSPNGDNQNDFFTIFNNDDDIVDYQISIYDRWGNAITIGKEWDGKNQKGEIIPGVYTYSAHLKSKFGSSKIYHGNVMLVK